MLTGNSAISIVFSRITLKLMEATRMVIVEDTDQMATHTMSFVPHAGSPAGSAEPFGSEQGSSILLTVMSAVIPETGEDGQELDEGEDLSPEGRSPAPDAP